MQKDIAEFMKKTENSELVQYLDKWFVRKTQDQDINDILTLIECFGIFLKISGQEIAELNAILNSESGKGFYNA
jgi:hypothetical protein